MPVNSVVEFLDQVRQSRALNAVQLKELPTLEASHREPKALAKELVKRGWLSRFQAAELLKGRAEQMVLGPYVLLDRLGEGGVGEVFQARHQMMKRMVAVKVLRPGRLTGAAIKRFQQEIEAAAALSHPHIVTAYDAGRVGDLFYFAMEHLEGANLSVIVRQRGPLPIAEACAWTRQAALGLQHAHEKGMVHRDVKPTNLFLTKAGVVKVLDFGMARVREGSSDTSGRGLTQLGALMGTPDYMAPEQVVNAHDVDIRADIYSLGCALFFLLTGKPPFPGKAMSDKLDAHMRSTAPSLRAVRAQTPEGLDAVLRKMMAKAPGERYQTPAEVAAALQPFCGDVAEVASGHAKMAATALYLQPFCDGVAEAATPLATATPVEAPSASIVVSPASKKRRWPVVAAALTVMALILVLALAGILWWNWPETQKPPGPVVRPDDPLPGLKKIEIGPPIWAKFDPSLLDALQADKIPPAERYPWQPKELVAVLGEHRLRGSIIALRPDGKQLAVCGGFPSNWIMLGDPETLHQQAALGPTPGVGSLAYSPDGKTLAAGITGSVQLWDIASGKTLPELKGHNGAVSCLAFSPDGTRLLCGDSEAARVWDVQDPTKAKVVHVLRPKEGGILSVAFSPLFPKDPRALVAGRDLQLWDVVTVKELAHVPSVVPRSRNNEIPYVSSVAFSPDGKEAVSGHFDMVVRVWKAGPTSLEEVASLQKHFNRPLQVAFTPKGDRIVCGSPDGGVSRQNAILLWDREKLIRVLRPDDGLSVQPLFLSDRHVVCAGSRFQPNVSVLDLESAADLTPPQPGHISAVNAVALSPDGRHVASGGDDYSCRLWDLTSLSKHTSFSAGNVVLGVGFTPDAKTLYFSSNNVNFVHFYDVKSGRRLETEWAKPDGNVRHATVSVDGRYLLTSAINVSGSLELWDLKNKERVRHRKTVGDLRVELSLDGERLLAIVSAASIWDVAAEKVLDGSWPGGITFTPDSRVARLGGAKIQLFDVNKGKPEPSGSIPVDTVGVSKAVFSRDGKRLGLAYANKLAVHDTPSGDKIWEWQVPVFVGIGAGGIDLSPDGRYLVAGNSNGTIYIIRLPAKRS